LWLREQLRAGFDDHPPRPAEFEIFFDQNLQHRRALAGQGKLEEARMMFLERRVNLRVANQHISQAAIAQDRPRPLLVNGSNSLGEQSLGTGVVHIAAQNPFGCCQTKGNNRQEQDNVSSPATRT
jgi:hypothetical protein